MPIKDSNSNIASISGRLLDKNKSSWIGNGVKFSNPEVISTSLTGISNWNTATPFSVNVIFEPNKSNSFQEVINNRHVGSGPENCFSISIRTDGTLWIALQNAGVSADLVVVPYDLNIVNVLTMTYSGSVIKAYKNGIFVGQVSSSRIIGSTNVYLGRVGGAVSQGLEGKIYDAKIFSKELTQSEVSHLYSTRGCDVPPTAISNTILNLKLEEKSGTTAVDKSGNSYNGTLTNFANTSLGSSNAHVDYLGRSITS